MAITSINAGTHPAASIQQARTDESDHVQAKKEAIPDHAQASEKAHDAVQLARAGGAAESSELTAAKAALRHSEDLPEARRTELLNRIASGYYNSPDVIDKVADKMADALQAGKKPGV